MSSGAVESSQTSSQQTPSERRYELFSMLDSDNLKTVEETKLIIQENLFASRDPSLINALVEYYLETRSSTALHILVNVHEARSHFLFEKMNDCLKHSQSIFRLDTLTILGHIVRRQPSWLYKIVKTSLFETLIKCMKSDNDIVILTTGMSILTTLLPQVPASVGTWLMDFFDIFTRMSSFRSTRTGNVPEVILLHLHVALYLFFHRLYAMYPNNFVTYLKSLSADNSKQALFQNTIKPMMQHVRFHPSLLTDSVQSETGKLRWRTKEPHDIVVDCLKVSLDPLDRIQEDSTVSQASKSLLETMTTLEKSINSIITASGEQIEACTEEPAGRLKARRMSDSATQTGKSLQSGDSGTGSMPLISAEDLAVGWSPSDVCGLSTPPSSQLSPATSNLDLTSSSALPTSQSNTAVTNTPRESPTTSLAGDVGFVYPYSVGVSKGKKSSQGKASSGRGTPVEAKTGSTESSLSKALHALAQERLETSPAPMAFGDYHTSTPKVARSTESEGLMHGLKMTPTMHDVEAKDGTSPDALRAVTDSAIAEQEDKERTREQNASDEVINEVMLKKQASGGSEGSDEHPFTCAGSTAGAQLASDLTDRGDLLPSQNKAKKNLLDHVNVTPCDSIYSPPLEDLDMSVASSRSQSATPTPQTSQHHLLPYSVLLSQNLPFLLTRGDQEGIFTELMSSDTKQVSVGPSPLEILDNYMRLGSSIHSEELARIPLVSFFDTEWTHFGGEPPVDELEILRGQVQLFHNQLLYERHKCELHAIRNRRLIGKTFKAVQFQEELLATKDQLGLQEEKMRELTEALVTQTEENRKVKDASRSWNDQQQTQLRNLLNENAMLQSSNKELTEKLELEHKKREELKLEVQKCMAQNFIFENEVKCVRLDLAEKEQLKVQVKELTKQVVVMGQLQQDQKDKIKKWVFAQGRSPEHALQASTCQRELAASKQTMRKQKTELEAMASQLTELESALNRKDIEIRELKKFTESFKGTYKGKLQCVEEKYSAQKKINHSLEAHIINLQIATEGERPPTRSHKDSETSLDRDGTLL